MLNINPFINFKSNISNSSEVHFSKNETKSTTSVFGSFLAPLAKDTISFTSNTRLNSTLMRAFDNTTACEIVHNDASVPEARLKRVLRDNFQDITACPDNPDAPIKEIITRIKAPESIREKVASELEKQITADIPSAFNPKDPESIKTSIKDIVGARIILAQADKENTNKVISALKKAIEKGDLNIKTVKYFTSPASTNGYFSDDELQSLVELSSETRQKQGKPATNYVPMSLESGYMALHLIVDLSDPDFKVKNNNYTGEIQIVGYDVSRLKDVEDFCYKLKSAKNIKNGNPAYQPFAKYFNSFIYNNKNWPNIVDDFNEYTRTAYRIQREKQAPVVDPKAKGKGKKREPYRLPSIAECSMEDKIPQGLDFNNLAKIKYHCDKIAELTKTELSV